MSTPANESIQSWVEAESLRKSPHGQWIGDPAGSVAAALAVLETPEVVSRLSAKRRERLAWNLPWMFTELRNNRGFLENDRVAFIRKSPPFLSALFGTKPEYSPALDMWWEVVLNGVSEDDGATRNAIFEALCSQLGSANDRCDASALHGFNHLGDRRCHSPINRWLAGCDDEELREYAKRAMRFELL